MCGEWSGGDGVVVVGEIDIVESEAVFVFSGGVVYGNAGML